MAAELNKDQLRMLCDALGWQGGTFRQVLETVKHLAAQSSTPIASAPPNERTARSRLWRDGHPSSDEFAGHAHRR